MFFIDKKNRNKICTFILILALVATLPCFLTSCGKSGSSDSTSSKKEEKSSSDKGVFVIKEKMFLTQITDIFFNIDDYKDRTIQVEGMFDYFPDASGNKTIPCVYRKGPGCCGNDGWGGFLLELPANTNMPKPNDWIIVTGTPYKKKDEAMQANVLFLKVKTIKVSDKRGAEFVRQ